MSLQDLLSDFVARINNSIMVGRPTAEVLKNNIVINVCKKLTSLGYFEGFEVSDRTLMVKINLERSKKIIRISKPGHRIYISYQDIPTITGGIGFNIISTSKGVLHHAEAAKNKVGGELLFQIY